MVRAGDDDARARDAARERRDEAEIEPPAITVIGDVAATRDRVVEFLRNDRERGEEA